MPIKRGVILSYAAKDSLFLGSRIMTHGSVTPIVRSKSRGRGTDVLSRAAVRC